MKIRQKTGNKIKESRIKHKKGEKTEKTKIMQKQT